MKNDDQPAKLPLWKNVAEFIEENHKPGDVIAADWFLKELRLKSVKEMDFGLNMAEIRRYLEHIGVYLSGRGLKGEAFALLPQRQNVDVMRAYNRQAVDKMSRSVILGNNTDRSALTEEEATRHESVLGKLAARYALLTRRNPEKILAQTAQPKQLTA